MPEVKNPFLGMKNKLTSIEIDVLQDDGTYKQESFFVKRSVKHAELFMSQAQSRTDAEMKAKQYTRAFFEMLRDGYSEQGITDIDPADLEAFIAANYGALQDAIVPLYNFAKKEDLEKLKKNLMKGKGEER